jgi:hypothetical protein
MSHTPIMHCGEANILFYFDEISIINFQDPVTILSYISMEDK